MLLTDKCRCSQRLEKTGRKAREKHTCTQVQQWVQYDFIWPHKFPKSKLYPKMVTESRTLAVETT